MNEVAIREPDVIVFLLHKTEISYRVKTKLGNINKLSNYAV